MSQIMFMDGPLLARIRSVGLFFPAFFLLFFIAGCASDRAAVEFQSDLTAHRYSQEFSRSFYTIKSDGEYNIVLAENGVWTTKSNPSGPLVSSTISNPLSQTLCIRILWKPQSSAKPDAPSATNAIIDWYVQTNGNGSVSDRLHYRGAGFVAVYESKDESRFVIRNARMELTESNGGLRDPLGTSSLTGSFIAHRDDGQVKAALALLHEGSTGSAPIQAGAHDGPPPRTPYGP